MIKLLRYSLSFILLLIVFSFNIKSESRADLKKWGYSWEDYDSCLFNRLQSINDILSYADSIMGADNRQSRAYSELLASTVRKRFYHGYSYYSLKDNWIAWLGGTLIWDHLHAIVLPDDMLKHPMAACSQQAIVLAACFQKAGIAYREVDLVGHFVLEGKVRGEWLFFDPNLEPHFIHGRKSLAELVRTGELAPAYRERLSPGEIKKVFAHPRYQEANASIAPNGTFFQEVTGTLSFVLPLLLPAGLLIFVVVYRMGCGTKDPEVKFVEVEESAEKTVEKFRVERG